MTNSANDQAQLFFKLCSDHLSIEAIPKKPVAIDFKRMKNRSINNHEIMMWTPHFVVLRNVSGQEITLRRDGRMVIRKATSELVAQSAATEVLDLILRDFRA